MAIPAFRGEQPVSHSGASVLSEPAARAPQAESSFLRAARSLGHQIDAGEAQVARASQFRNYDTATLIALQAGIYRYTEAVDLASKIVDRGATAVRTVLQGSSH